MLETLCVAGLPRDDDRMQRAADWLKAQQLCGPENDVALKSSTKKYTQVFNDELDRDLVYVS